MNVQTKKTGRPPKYGLCWLKLDVNFTEDFRIMKLSDKYGPNGVMIFINLICLVYREGYYLEEPMEMLALAVMRRIGSKWLESVEYVCEVIRYCAGIGLFDDDLLKEEVLTSVGIQRRYGEICSRRKADRSMYWLLQKEKDDDPAAERRVSAAKSAQEKETEKEEDKKKEKEKEKPTASPPTLSQVKAFCEKEGLSVDPEKFCNYYDSFGWKKNGQVIEKWQPVLLNWEKTERERTPRAAPVQPAHTPSYDLSECENYDIFAVQPMKTEQSA